LIAGKARTGFGEIALLQDIPRTATVRAVSDFRLRALSRASFIGAITGHGDASRLGDAVVAERVARTSPADQPRRLPTHERRRSRDRGPAGQRSRDHVLTAAVGPGPVRSADRAGDDRIAGSVGTCTIATAGMRSPTRTAPTNAYRVNPSPRSRPPAGSSLPTVANPEPRPRPPSHSPSTSGRGRAPRSWHARSKAPRRK
jgi:hypothetical protein